MPSKRVREITERINEIHERKNQDYAMESNPFSNFERMGDIAEWFDDPTHKAFVQMIGNKLARLAELLNGKSPKNESIDDNFLDLDTYCCLFHAYYLEHFGPTSGAAQESDVSNWTPPPTNFNIKIICYGCGLEITDMRDSFAELYDNRVYHKPCKRVRMEEIKGFR